MPTFAYSKQMAFRITDNGGTLRDVSSQLISVEGLPGERELYDVTALGDSGRRWFGGLENGQINLEVWWAADAGTGVDTVFGPLRTDTTVRAWDFGPEGTASTKTKYSGSMLERSYMITGRVGNVHTARVAINVDGTIARGTY